MGNDWSDWRPNWDHPRDRVQQEFGEFALRFLRSRPPKILGALTADDREDAVSEIIYHCLKDDCHKLKQYQPRGVPFAAWFRTVAVRRILEIMRGSTMKDPREPEVGEEPSESDEGPGSGGIRKPKRIRKTDPLEHHPGLQGHSDIERETMLRILLEKVWRVLQDWPENDRSMVLLHAEGMPSRFIAVVLNVPIAEVYRIPQLYQKLRKQLRELGIDPDGVF